MEALKGGTLKEVVFEYQKQRKGLKEDWIREITRQVVSALAYCHSLRLIHKDIKDENIMLLKKEGRFDKPFAVIIDLGVAEMFALSDPTGREVGGTPVTMAPEVWLNRFGPKCDVFSVGCVLFELMTGNFPFMATSMNPDAWIRLHRRGPDWTLFKCSDAGRKMCQAMLTFVEEKRPTMSDCLRHDWFTTPQRELKTVTPAQLIGLQSFAKESSVKRTLLLEIASRLPIERATEIVELFEGLDENADGRLSRDELELFLRKGGVADDELISQIWKALDVDENGELSFSEFSAGILLVYKDLLEDRLEELARHYDRDKDGVLDKDQVGEMMQAVAAALGDETSSGIVEEVLRSQQGGDQRLKYTDFKNYMIKPSGRGPDLKIAGTAVSSSRSSVRSGRRAQK
jgi:serine/threonine protein kinase